MSQKTKREWLETLPDGYRQRAIAHAEKTNAGGLSHNCDDLHYAVSSAFSWYDTKEGHAFWSAVACGNLPPFPADPTPTKPKKSTRPADLEVPSGWRELREDEKGPSGTNWIVGAKFAGYGGEWKYNEYAAERVTKGPGCFPERWSRVIVPITPSVEANPYIPWPGGECPVPKGTLVDVRYKDGTEIFGQKAGEWSAKDKYAPISWAADCGSCSIVAYRLHKPEPAVAAPPADPYAELKQAHKDGKTIELLMGSDWSVRKQPDWTCPPEKYRVQPTAAPKWHNPENVSLNKVPSGWRFMVEGENDGRHKGKCRLWWAGKFHNGFWKGDSKNDTYIVPDTIPLSEQPVAASPPPPKWTLPPPPSGRQWHRDDWTEDMLPEGWRPLLFGEPIEATDEGRIDHKWHRADKNNHSKPMGNTVGDHCNNSNVPVRTRRPLPDSSAATITLPHIPQPDGWIPWSGKDSNPPVDKNTKVEVKFRHDGTQIGVAGDWNDCWRDDHNPYDIIAYRVLEVPAATPVQQPTTPAHPPLPDGYELYTGPKDGRWCKDSLYWFPGYTDWLPNTYLTDSKNILYAIPITKPDWHNPENVPMDKIPDGWRLRTKKEAGIKATSQCRVWDGDRFRAETHYAGTAKDWTYIVPIDTPAQPSPQPRNPTEQEQTPAQTTQKTQTQQQTQHTTMTTEQAQSAVELPAINSVWAVDGYDRPVTILGAGPDGVTVAWKDAFWRSRNFRVIPTNKWTQVGYYNKTQLKPGRQPKAARSIFPPGIHINLDSRWTRIKRNAKLIALGFALAHANNPVVKATVSAGWNASKAFVQSLWS